MHTRWRFLSGILVGFSGSATTAQRVHHDGMTCLHGTMHVHTGLSGDYQGDTPMSPRQACERALAAGLDFVAISDHHKASDARGPTLRIDPDMYISELFEVCRDFSVDHAGAFVALPGIEWGTTSTGNHLNVIGAETLPPDSIRDAEYEELYEWAVNNAGFLQGNHPNSFRPSRGREHSGNYGRARYDSEREFVKAADPILATMSIICTVPGGHISGTLAQSTNKSHRDVHGGHFARWLDHLNMGFHVAPAANQDTHRENIGTVTAARTGVWVENVTQAGLIEAIRARRVFATEDDELAVALQARVGASTPEWMGSTVTVPDSETDVGLLVMIAQAGGTHGDATNEGPYTVSLWMDSDGVGGAEASELDSFAGIEAETMLEISVTVSPGQYVFISVTEENGSDNPGGEGDDEFDNSSGAFASDGVRDNLNDDAWTSPIWFTADDAAAAFVWTRNSSKFYHLPGCWAAGRIGEANRRTGDTPPPDRELHDCSTP